MTKEFILSALKDLGVKEHMSIIVHSSLKSFGYVEGGGATVAQALMEAVCAGTLIMPSFNHGAPYDNGAVFDIRKTPTTNGAIPDAFWRMEGVERSMNPTHSFAVWGKDARLIAERHELSDAVGKNSPLDYLYEHDGYALLLGVGYNRNTFHHYVERTLNAPCLRGRGEEYDVIDANGALRRARTWSWRNASCPIDDSALYARNMRPYETVHKIGDCTATWFPLKKCFDVVSKSLREGLDQYPPCAACQIAPRVCRYTVAREGDNDD